MINKITSKNKPNLKNFRRLGFDNIKTNPENKANAFKKKTKRSILPFNTYYKFPYTIFCKNNHYKHNLFNKQKLKFFYGHLSIKDMKKNINVLHLSNNNDKISNLLNRYFFFFNDLAVQLQYILYKSCFVINLQQSKQLIKHGHIKVNNFTVKNPTYKLQAGDMLSISKRYFGLVNLNLKKKKEFSLIPKSLQINYKTLQICFIFPCALFNLQFPFEFYVNSLDRYFQAKNC